MAEILKQRKQKARATDVIIGALTERLAMAVKEEHQARVDELMDELRRSLSKKEDEE